MSRDKSLALLTRLISLPNAQSSFERQAPQLVDFYPPALLQLLTLLILHSFDLCIGNTIQDGYSGVAVQSADVPE